MSLFLPSPCTPPELELLSARSSYQQIGPLCHTVQTFDLLLPWVRLVGLLPYIEGAVLDHRRGGTPGAFSLRVLRRVGMGNKLSGSDTRTTTVPGRSRGNRSSTASAPAPTAAATAPAAPTAPAATVSSSGESPSRPERRPRSSSTPVFTTRARRWLQMRRVGSATQGAASPANIFRRSNSGSRGSNGGQSESTERRGLGLRSAGRYVRSRMMPSRSSSVHEGSSRRQRRSFRTMSMLGHRGRENSAVAGAADFVPSVRGEFIIIFCLFFFSGISHQI